MSINRPELFEMMGVPKVEACPKIVIATTRNEVESNLNVDGWLLKLKGKK